MIVLNYIAGFMLGKATRYQQELTNEVDERHEANEFPNGWLDHILGQRADGVSIGCRGYCAISILLS